MTAWRDLIAQVETQVDGQWGEQVQFLPYKSGEYLTAPVVDNSRNAVTATGVVYGRSSILRAAGNTGFTGRRSEADFLLSILGAYLPDVRKGDRFKLLERNNEVCEVSQIDPGTNGRYLIHLIRRVA